MTCYNLKSLHYHVINNVNKISYVTMQMILHIYLLAVLFGAFILRSSSPFKGEKNGSTGSVNFTIKRFGH